MTSNSMRWVLLAVGAVALTATATAVVTGSLTAGGAPLSAAQVDQQLAGGATPTPGATAADQSVSLGDNGSVVFQLTPAVVTVRCENGLATLESWSPNPGYRADDPVRGPAAQVSVRFESDSAQDYQVKASCTGDSSVSYIIDTYDDHGGGPDNHGGSGKG